MPKLTEHHSAKFVKLMYLGNSGTGKTGSLVSLVGAGYKLRILDMDNGLESLRQEVARQFPDKMENVDYITLRDDIVAGSNGPLIMAKAYVKAVKFLSKWEDDSVPSEWGEDTILVVDSLTSLGDAALAWAEKTGPSSKDRRQYYFMAQESIEHLIAMMTSEAWHSNVIICTHISYKELEEGVNKGWPSAVGSAIGPKLPKYFNTMIQAEVVGSGASVKRKIRTIPSAQIDLKNPTPFRIEGTYDLNTGLAEVFGKLKTLD